MSNNTVEQILRLQFFFHLGVELWVQQRARQQTTLQNAEHLQIQLSEKRPVGGQTDAWTDLFFFLLFRLLL